MSDATMTSELEAVNILLRGIGERPVVTLDGLSNVTKASLARETLHRVSRQLQITGWSFNSETGFPLTPDSSTMNIQLPVNTLKCDPVDQTQDYANRGARLYDRTNHTYTFSSTVLVNIVFFLTWDELPEHARNYITVKAARIFQKETVGATDQNTLMERDEQRAWVDFVNTESDLDTPNILTTIPALNRSVNPR